SAPDDPAFKLKVEKRLAAIEEHWKRKAEPRQPTIQPEPSKALNEPKPARSPIFEAQAALLKSTISAEGYAGVEQFAKCIGISDDTVYAICRGDQARFSQATLDAVLKKLKISKKKWLAVAGTQRA